MNSIQHCKRLINNREYFKMQFHDIQAKLDTDIDSYDIAEILFDNNRIEFVNHDGICFTTDDTHIYEIWDHNREMNYVRW